jgi:hypothetical protein
VQREESTTGAIIALAQGGKFQGAPDRWPRLDAHSRADELSEGLSEAPRVRPRKAYKHRAYGDDGKSHSPR